MFKPSSTSVAKPVTDQLLSENIILGAKSPTYPVGVVANHFFAPVQENYKSLSSEDLVALKNQFVEFNAQQTAYGADEYDNLVTLMADGVTRMLNTVRTLVVPYCKEIEADFSAMVAGDSIPSIEVAVFNYAAIHAQSGLYEHLVTAYQGIQVQEQYRTFRIEFPGVEKMIEWISSNPHVDSTTTAEWAVGLGEDRIKSVWWELFERDRTLALDASVNFNKSGLPQNIDAVLLGYFLTIYLCNEPQDVLGESVSLQEWKDAFTSLHQFIGSLLAYAYDRRIKDQQNERVVIASSVYNAISGDINVVVNGDIWQSWLNNGGDVKQVLGAAVAAPTVQNAARLGELKDELITTWNRKHYIFKQTKLDSFNANRRKTLVSLISNDYTSSDLRKLLPVLTSEEIRARAVQLTAAMSDVQLDDRPRAIKDIVCGVFYPNTPYREFLNTMDRVAQDLADLPPREVSLIAVVEMVAQWLAKQVEATRYECDIRDQPEPDFPAAGPTVVDVVVDVDPATVIEQPVVPVTEEQSNVTTEPELIVQAPETEVPAEEPAPVVVAEEPVVVAIPADESGEVPPVLVTIAEGEVIPPGAVDVTEVVVDAEPAAAA